MTNLNSFWDDLAEETKKAFIYKPMTEEEYEISCVNDIIEWATEIMAEWDGDNPGSLEDRAHQADEIIGLCNELIKSIKTLGTL